MCEVYFTSGIIKDKKIDLRNKWRKAVSLMLDTNCYWDLMRDLDSQTIETYEFKILRSEFWPMMTWMIRVSLSTTLVIYKAYFKSHWVWKQRLRTHILCEKLLCLCALRFCNQVLPNFQRLWNEELCSQ